MAVVSAKTMRARVGDPDINTFDNAGNDDISAGNCDTGNADNTSADKYGNSGDDTVACI
jgi:hypothetical protein